MYEGLKSDFASDPFLLADLENSKSKLKIFFQKHYARQFSQSTVTNLRPSQSLSSITVRTQGSVSSSPEKVSFTSRYQMKDRIMVDEIEEYLKLPREDFEHCKPLHWWLGRRSQFPNLYRLVCDIFSIPGKTVGVQVPVEANPTPLRFCCCG
jgi:hAT family C-terminal dimerisation region